MESKYGYMNNKFEKENLLGAIAKLSRAVRRYTSNNKDHISRIDALRVYLLKNKDINLNELAYMLDVRPPSLSEWIEKLADSEEITKTRDEADKRIIRYSLTPKGQEIAKEAEARISQSHNIFDDCLSEDDEKAFIQLCEKLYDHLHDKIDEKNALLDLEPPFPPYPPFPLYPPPHWHGELRHRGYMFAGPKRKRERRH